MVLLPAGLIVLACITAYFVHAIRLGKAMTEYDEMPKNWDAPVNNENQGEMLAVVILEAETDGKRMLMHGEYSPYQTFVSDFLLWARKAKSRDEAKTMAMKAARHADSMFSKYANVGIRYETRKVITIPERRVFWDYWARISRKMDKETI